MAGHRPGIKLGFKRVPTTTTKNRRIKMNTRKILVCFLAVLVGAVLCSAVYAQDNKILMTTSQQYQNMVPNASFESWDSTNVKPADWSRLMLITAV